MKNQILIDGQWQDSLSHETYSRVNPANPDEVLGDFQKGNSDDMRLAIDAADDAFHEWSDMPPTERARYLLRAGEIIEQQKQEMSLMITKEMGKTLRDSSGEIQQTIDLAYYVAAEGRRLLGQTSTSERSGVFNFTLKLPIGVIGLITPWNFPIFIAARKIFYSLLCGNTVVLKPSSETPQCATRLFEIFQETNIPNGVVNFVTGPGEVIGNTLITDNRVRMISFCGHKDTGTKIMKNAGPKRVSLELGGKNPLIIMDDADLDLAVDALVWGGYSTTGQRCTASSRVIVHEKTKEKVERMAVEKIRKLRIGDGLDPHTDVGPLVNQKALIKTKEYCQIGNREGAKLLTGGKAPKQLKGWYFEPTLFTNCKADMRICKEEIFGPVVSIISAKDLDEAIQIANSVDYGLSSAIYTASIRSALVATKKLQAGLTYVNHPTIGSQVHMPFGGVKFSGNNREGGAEGINEFTELKTVCIDYQNDQETVKSKVLNNYEDLFQGKP
jgi:alpha-ketoglutaric semialdehyde dehydrogenase